jgi:hypothetical protein
MAIQHKSMAAPRPAASPPWLSVEDLYPLYLHHERCVLAASTLQDKSCAATSIAALHGIHLRPMRDEAKQCSAKIASFLAKQLQSDAWKVNSTMKDLVRLASQAQSIRKETCDDGTGCCVTFQTKQTVRVFFTRVDRDATLDFSTTGHTVHVSIYELLIEFHILGNAENFIVERVMQATPSPQAGPKDGEAQKRGPFENSSFRLLWAAFNRAERNIQKAEARFLTWRHSMQPLLSDQSGNDAVASKMPSQVQPVQRAAPSSRQKEKERASASSAR